MEEKDKIIPVPKGIRYLSNWNEFGLEDFPMILNKKVPGCGFTEWALTNNEDVILCSPRRILIENKWEQHKDSVFMVKNDIYDELNVDKNLNTEEDAPVKFNPMNITSSVLEEQKKQLEIEDKKNRFIDFKKLLDINLPNYIISRHSENKPAKILVTYDSFKLVRAIIGETDILKYRIIVDEMQSIFTDSRFKPDTDIHFVSQLNGLSKVAYVSATPMMSKYLKDIDEFKNLPYYELDWESLDQDRLRKPKIEVRYVRSIYKKAGEIIDKYKNSTVKPILIKNDDGTIKKIVSNEAMIFVNSVKNIIEIIKDSSLKPSEVNILCARTKENQDKINKKLKHKRGEEGYIIGRVPLDGEPRKMITLCTRTVYLGADFYSDNAKIYILSDAGIDCLAVDISLDLPQIMGRLRNTKNPWNEYAELYIKSISSDTNIKKLTKDDFDKKIEDKLNKTKNYITTYNRINNVDVDKSNELNSFVDLIKTSMRYEGYNKSYTTIDPYSTDTTPKVNKLVLISERRAFDIQQIDYADRFSVFKAIGNVGLSLVNQKLNEDLDNFMKQYNKLNTIQEKLKFICESDLDDTVRKKVECDEANLNIRELLVAGKEKCKSLGYNSSKIRKYLGIKYIEDNSDELTTLIYDNFNIGDKLSGDTIKSKLEEIYSKVGIEKIIKTTDLNKWFNLKRVWMVDDSKKTRFKGYLIQKK